MCLLNTLVAYIINCKFNPIQRADLKLGSRKASIFHKKGTKM